ncbi:MAG TPA: O-antigen ligase family protein [Syntrophorhabdaceae bacterium]|nr:O-antigen ligase family protein [Syntrophorhabdaceae bacterium]
MAEVRTERPFFRLFLSILIGAGIAMLSVLLASLDFKTAIAVMLGLCIGGIFIYFLNQRILTYFLIMILGFGIPFNLDINLFIRRYVGVTSIDIGITLLSSIMLYFVFYYEHIMKGIKRFYSNRTMLMAMFLYIGACILSFYNAMSIELSVFEIVRLIMLLIIFYMVMNLGSRENISIFLITISACVILEFLLAYYQYTTGRSLGLAAFGERSQEELGFISRASGTFGHANGLAYFFELLLPLLLAMIIVEDKKILKLWYIISFLFGFFGLIITFSRGGWLATAISLPMVFIFLYRKRFTQLRYYPAIFTVFIVVIILGSIFYPTIERRLIAYDYGSAGTRGPLNLAAISIIKQYPITGVGINNFALIFRTYDTTGGSALFKTQAHIVHNLFLGVWAETGTIGILAFVWIFISAFIVASRLLLKVPFWYSGILIGVMAGILAQLLHGMVDPGFRILMNTSMLVYSMLGLIGAVSVLYKTQQKQLA